MNETYLKLKRLSEKLHKAHDGLDSYPGTRETKYALWFVLNAIDEILEEDSHQSDVKGEQQ